MSDDLACQAFTYYVPGFQPLRWNITLAQVICDQIPGAIVSTVEVEREEMGAIVERNEIDPQKVAALSEQDLTLPGIGAPIRHQGQVFYILIDGNSRCKRAYDDGRPFFVRLLSDRAAQACLIDGPKELLPWES